MCIAHNTTHASVIYTTHAIVVNTTHTSTRNTTTLHLQYDGLLGPGVLRHDRVVDKENSGCGY